MQYLVEHQDTIALNEVKVLDLGCGVGILGIYALLNGSFVTFQDYVSVHYNLFLNYILCILCCSDMKHC